MDKNENNMIQLSLNTVNDNLNGYEKVSNLNTGNSYIESTDISIIADCNVKLKGRNGNTKISNINYLINDNRLRGNIFNNPYTTNVLCSYSNDEYISIEGEAERFVEARAKEKGNLEEEKKFYNNMNKNIEKILNKIDNTKLDKKSNEYITDIINSYYGKKNLNEKKNIYLMNSKKFNSI